MRAVAGRPMYHRLPVWERSHRGLVRRFAKPLSGVTCSEGSNPSLSATAAPAVQEVAHVKVITVLLVAAVALLVGPSVSLAAETAAIGVFKPRACSVSLETSRQVDCGSIQLPQLRSDPSRGTVRLNLAIVRAKNPLPDPILFVMGGPDYPGVDGFSTFYLGGKAFSKNRDWILFDARGIGTC